MVDCIERHVNKAFRVVVPVADVVDAHAVLWLAEDAVDSAIGQLRLARIRDDHGGELAREAGAVACGEEAVHVAGVGRLQHLLQYVVSEERLTDDRLADHPAHDDVCCLPEVELRLRRAHAEQNRYFPVIPLDEPCVLAEQLELAGLVGGEQLQHLSVQLRKAVRENSLRRAALVHGVLACDFAHAILVDFFERRARHQLDGVQNRVVAPRLRGRADLPVQAVAVALVRFAHVARAVGLADLALRRNALAAREAASLVGVLVHHLAYLVARQRRVALVEQRRVRVRVGIELAGHPQLRADRL